MTENIDTMITDLISDIKELATEYKYNQFKDRYSNLITETDKNALRKEVEMFISSDPYYSFDALKTQFLIGMDNGYTIEEQLQLIKQIFII